MLDPDHIADGAGPTEARPEGVPVAEAARHLGLDAFTVYTFIQRDRLRAVRAPSGEILVPQGDLVRLLRRRGPC
jgi:predicted site-specific integrase-resolvase